jgi:uncharacterized protein YraI
MKTTLRLAFVALLAQSLGASLFAADSAPAPYTATTTGNNVLVRGQATTASESLGKLKKGDPVTVLDSIKVSKPKGDDPTNWFKIQLPATIPVWVHALYVDTNAMTVKTKTLNLRGGPGENYSKLGTLPKGAALKAQTTKDGWIRIETPETAFGFVAANYFVRKEDATPVPPPIPEPQPPIVPIVVKETNAPAPPAATNTAPLVVETVPNQPQVVAAMDTPAPAVIAATPIVPAITNLEPAVVTPAVTNQTTIVEVLPPERRVVTREGIVDHSYHLNFPSWFVLKSPENNQLLDYLITTDTNLVLKKLVGKRVLVKGEEGMDKRWKTTPVLTIDTIEPLP